MDVLLEAVSREVQDAWVNVNLIDDSGRDEIGPPLLKRAK
jgi:hypothetical protein